MPRKKRRSADGIVFHPVDEQAPEWFYPFARMLHDHLKQQHASSVPLPGFEPEDEFRTAGDPAKLDGFRLIGTKGSNVYMGGLLHLGGSRMKRYKLRIPKSRFLEMAKGVGEIDSSS